MLEPRSRRLREKCMKKRNDDTELLLSRERSNSGEYDAESNRKQVSISVFYLSFEVPKF